MPRKKINVIAIDGPAGVGKSTVGRLAAKKLKISFFSSGQMYRALALCAIKRGINPNSGRAMGALVKTVRWKFRNKKKSPVLDAGINGGFFTSAEISGRAASVAASALAKHKSVRNAVISVQRRLGLSRALVMEGRDIGTVVFPDAKLKIYLDACAEQRAKRRALQIKKRGGRPVLKDILKGIIARDKADSERKNSPLKPAKDAVIIDTSKLTRAKVVSSIVELAEI